MVLAVTREMFQFIGGRHAQNIEAFGSVVRDWFLKVRSNYPTLTPTEGAGWVGAYSCANHGYGSGDADLIAGVPGTMQS